MYFEFNIIWWILLHWSSELFIIKNEFQMNFCFTINENTKLSFQKSAIKILNKIKLCSFSNNIPKKLSYNFYYLLINTQNKNHVM